MRKGISSTKFLIDPDEDECEGVERLSSITLAFFDEDDPYKFLKVYNRQGHYSAS
jgi:hypothetical protein